MTKYIVPSLVATAVTFGILYAMGQVTAAKSIRQQITGA